MPRRASTKKLLIIADRPVTIPTVDPVTVNGEDVVLPTVTVTETDPVTFMLSGTVGDELEGVTITIEGRGTTLTNVNGDWFYPNLPAGTYTITPTKTNYAFSPSSKSATITDANVTGQDFAITPKTITGTITGETVSDITVTLELDGETLDTDTVNNDEEYSFSITLNDVHGRSRKRRIHLHTVKQGCCR